jgi:hypothetical protein
MGKTYRIYKTETGAAGLTRSLIDTATCRQQAEYLVGMYRTIYSVNGNHALITLEEEQAK